MKAVTVAGGSSEDPKSEDPRIEGTAVAGTDPDDTSTHRDTEDGAEAGAVPEGRSSPAAGAGEGEPDAEAVERAGASAEAGDTAAPVPADTGTEPEDGAASKDADATRVLKAPVHATATDPADGPGAESRTDSEDAPADAVEPEGADAEGEAPEASDATRVLKVPARAATDTPEDDAEEGKGAEEGDDASADAEDPAAGVPEGDDVTRVLKMPPRPTEADGTLTLAKPKPKSKPEPEPEPEPKPKPEPKPTAIGGGDAKRPAADRAEPGAGRSAGEDTARKDGDGPRVPGWAKGGDADSERTSQFVALKDLDVPPPAPARPQPRPQPRPQSAPQPLPPLDLLAELTNTPAPPETPRRTALRRVKVWAPILLLLAGACIGGQMLRPLPAPRLVAAEAERTVDGQFAIPWPGKGQGAVRVVGSGDIGTFGEQKPVPTASVAKVMTAYVVLKGHPLRKDEAGPAVTVDAKAVADGNSEHESRITGLTAGSKFSQQDMLKMLMIPSGNNIARLLARWDTGTDSEAAFVEKMNAAARDLGMKDTTYTDPSGLDAGTVSTAADQLKLAEAVMKDDAFRAIVAMPEAPVKGLGTKLVNNNHLLTDLDLSVRGIKTGSSTPAGGTFVWASYKRVGDKDRLILGSLMEQRAPAPDKDALNSLALVKANSKKIIEAVRAGLASTALVRKGDTVGYVDDGLGGRTPLVAVKDLNVVSVPGQRFKLSLTPGASPLPHTAKAGTEVAVLTAGEGEGAQSVPVAVQGALAEPSFGTRLTRLG
ncbi:serine hydrolase [Streptomyces sp. NPDC056254]|uniref:serine hydrolase n=1 Tax=Streptomyces sp. NPDC056254 TaxID=3345763 RepID=UPI0035DBE86F